jgi:hypothetical protein
VKLPEDLALPGYELSWRDSSRELEVLEPWTGGAQLRLRLLDTWHVSQAWLGPSSTSLLALDAQGRFHRWTLLPPAPTDAVELLNAACRAEGSDAAHPFCQGLREELAAREERCWTRPIEPVFPDDATDRERMHPLEVWIDGQQLGHVSTHLSHERAVRPGQRVLLKGDCSRGEYVAPEEPEGCEAWLRDAPTLRVPMERRACDEPPR